LAASRAGTEVALVETLCPGGARPDGIDDDGLPLWTAITRGHARGAEALVACVARVDNPVFAAALDDLPSLEASLRTDDVHRTTHPARSSSGSARAARRSIRPACSSTR
jgi:hypothetical protein